MANREQRLMYARILWSRDDCIKARDMIRRLALEYPTDEEVVETYRYWSAMMWYIDFPEAYAAYEEWVAREVCEVFKNKFYVDGATWRYAAQKAYITAYCEGKENLSILDIGCQQGEVGRFYLQDTPQIAEYVGVDIAPTMIKYACLYSQNEPRMAFGVAGSHSLPFEDKTFDIVVLGGILEHVPTNLDATLAEAERVCKGIIVGNFPKGGMSYWGAPTFPLRAHINDIDPTQLLGAKKNIDCQYMRYVDQNALPWARYDEVGEFCWSYSCEE